MKWTIASIFAIIVFVIGCGKDKFNTKPSLTLKSINTHTVQVGNTLNLEFEFTDKEGDVNDTIYIKKIRVNKKVLATIRDSFALKVPDFPKNSKGVIQLNMTYQNYLVSAKDPGNAPNTVNDTLNLKFVLKDKANNKSDTVTVNQVVIIR